MSHNDIFRRFSQAMSRWTGSPWAFILSLLGILGWASLGPRYGYSETWQLVVNTGTTIITFLMIFLVQNTQNRDALAIHLKLDELIRAVKEARNGLVDLEEMTDAELEKLQGEFARLRERTPPRSVEA